MMGETRELQRKAATAIRGAAIDRNSATRILAPEVGFEPTTNRLTADRSTTELLWIVSPFDGGVYLAHDHPRRQVLFRIHRRRSKPRDFLIFICTSELVQHTSILKTRGGAAW